MKRCSFLIPFFLFSSVSAFGAGCSSADSEQKTPPADESSIVDVAQTAVERQAIGNCWIYAHASWVESMHMSATGESFDLSQSYWTYWHWFDQVVTGFSDKVSTGGNWWTANGIVQKYGLMAEKDFINADTESETSTRQKQALDALNESMKTGALSDPVARRDRKIVRAEMDRAWGLTAEQTAMLDLVFGESVTRTFAGSSPADPSGSPIVRAEDFAVAYPAGPGQPKEQKTLSTAMSEWRQVYYWAEERRSFLQRVQRALHDAQPVVITWFVDFNAMETGDTPLRGSFNMDRLNQLGPGRQGGHMTVLEDYQAKLADGTVLQAGETLDPRNPEHAPLLERALASETEVQFVRVKNSWGTARPDRAFVPGMPGYHDLYLNYLGGSVRRCREVHGETDTKDCPFEETPLQNVVLPPGY